jgi:hypothetical protein
MTSDHVTQAIVHHVEFLGAATPHQQQQAQTGTGSVAWA